MRSYHVDSGAGLSGLTLREEPEPTPGPGQVVVAVRAVSLSYRELLILRGAYVLPVKPDVIPVSDGAGEVVAIGEGVERVRPGDRVTSTLFPRWHDGPYRREVAAQIGGSLDGMLTELAVVEEDALVAMPEHLSFAEAATLPCAALTAWNALAEAARVKAGDTVLLLGTGGVSIFGLQFAKLMGARPIIISSSDAKLDRAKALGAAHTINYRTTPEWDRAVLDLTNGVGVDATVEVGGAGTLPKSINATRIAGTISLIGVLAGGQIDPAQFMRKSIKMQGIYVGSRRMFRDMNRAIAFAGLKPVIDQTFTFEKAKDAYHTMQAAGHFGKIVIRV